MVDVSVLEPDPESLATPAGTPETEPGTSEVNEAELASSEM